MDHVGLLRLFELAQMPAIINTPEWEHIKDCANCGRGFLVLKGAMDEGSPQTFIWTFPDIFISGLNPSQTKQFSVLEIQSHVVRVVRAET
jgi:hypothetical protein